MGSRAERRHCKSLGRKRCCKNTKRCLKRIYGVKGFFLVPAFSLLFAPSPTPCSTELQTFVISASIPTRRRLASRQNLLPYYMLILLTHSETVNARPHKTSKEV